MGSIILKKHKTRLTFLLFLNIEIVLVIEMSPQWRQGLLDPALSVSWQRISWWHIVRIQGICSHETDLVLQEKFQPQPQQMKVLWKCCEIFLIWNNYLEEKHLKLCAQAQHKVWVLYQGSALQRMLKITQLSESLYIQGPLDTTLWKLVYTGAIGHNSQKVVIYRGHWTQLSESWYIQGPLDTTLWKLVYTGAIGHNSLKVGIYRGHWTQLRGKLTLTMARKPTVIEKVCPIQRFLWVCHTHDDVIKWKHFPRYL